MHMGSDSAGAWRESRASRLMKAATRFSGRWVEDRNTSARWKKRAYRRWSVKGGDLK